MKRLFVVSGLFLLSSIASGGTIDMRTCELTYNYAGSLGGNNLSAVIVCRPVSDTAINGIDVLKYRFISTDADSVDTGFDYLKITDTSVVNYAWRGNTPFILLKRAFSRDTLYIEESPYTTFAFPFKLNATWLTRPESTGLQSRKEYVARESLTTQAGTFFCDKVHTDLLVSMGLADAYSELWSVGNTVIKTFINEGNAAITDEIGNPIDTVFYWELFELKAIRALEPDAVYERHIVRETHGGSGNIARCHGAIALNGKSVRGQRRLAGGVYIIGGSRRAEVVPQRK